MTLTGQGYVALGAQAAPVKKFNPHHDERGRFASVDGAGGGRQVLRNRGNVRRKAA
ncbi:hypothetical protein [uncultured Methylovirgula sp.]|uniref:hypothetical protein n=1 Tax=uncultured Methylovirgula sp. TaxID=1285960 RepID=UPI0026322624|nr:hypothetical protein [uncultured Methylovirgula sp.]